MQGTAYVYLENFDQRLRDYQLDVVDDATEFVAESLTLGEFNARRLYASPTGTGKGSMQLGLLKQLRAEGYDAAMLTPSLEVLRGCLERCGASPADLACGPERLADMGERIHVYTCVRYQNKVLRGELGMPEVVIYDEAHHATEGNEVSGTLFALAPDAVWLGFTATPYRGTPQGTKDLHEAWGEPIVVLTVPEAVEAGYQSLPSFEVIPLVDDDTIKVVAGKFQAKAAGNRVQSRLDALCDLVAARTDGKPTCVVVPNTETAGRVVEELDARGIGARMVLGSTPTARRALAYRECREGRSVLVAVKVLNEGVDLPWLRRLIDARPTVSAVAWVQQIGRIMRPGPVQPEYICVCRNLERHAYLLGGAVPRAAIKQAQDAFEKPSKRDGYRSIGFEQLSRFKRIQVPLDGGLRATMANVYSVDGEGVKTEWCVVCLPWTSAPVVAQRRTQINRDPVSGEIVSYDPLGKWQATRLPDDLAGFATSQQTGALSDKQRQWWERAARRYGLDEREAGELKRRQFQVLPVLSDLKVNLLDVKEG